MGQEQEREQVPVAHSKSFCIPMLRENGGYETTKFINYGFVTPKNFILIPRSLILDP